MRITYNKLGLWDKGENHWARPSLRLIDTLPAHTRFISASEGFSFTVPSVVLGWPLPSGVFSPPLALARTVVLSITSVPGGGWLANTASVGDITDSVTLAIIQPRVYMPLVFRQY
jgi:hypothetical protein